MLPITIGVDSEGKQELLNLTTLYNILIVGMTGMGVNLVLDSSIKSLIEKEDPSTLRLLLIGEQFNAIRNLVRDYSYKQTKNEAPIINRSEDATTAIISISLEMDRRYALFKDFQAKNIKQYNTFEEIKEKLPYIVVAISSFEKLDDSVVDEILSIMNRNAAAGIYFIVGTQRFSVVSERLLANCNAKVCFRSSMASESVKIIGQPNALHLQKGEMLLKLAGTNDSLSKLRVLLPK